MPRNSEDVRLTVETGDRCTVRMTRMVESRCGEVALGRTYMLLPLASGGALVVQPWLRFHMAPRPLDKRGAEDLFERHELAADGGQGKTQLTARGRQVPSIRNLNEHSHRRELVHGRIIAKNGRMSRQISSYSPKPGDSMLGIG